ncbi:MAG: DUF1653 domain-containing protein [archaeon]|jgi:hypothetical protein
MEIKQGQIWVHYKGINKRYEIIALGKDSNTLEDLVVYKALYQGEFKFGQIWIRPVKEFLETVEKNGEKFNRFSLIEE